MSDDTLPRLPSNTTDSGGGDDEIIVVIAYCEEEPERIGESFAFARLGMPCVLGRGPGEGDEQRVEPGPWRPGEPLRGAGLRGERSSRRLLEFEANAVGVRVKLLAAGELYVNGERIDAGFAGFGSTIRVDKRLLLYVARRRAYTCRYLLPAARGCRFGEPDRFEITGEGAELYRMLDQVAYAAQSGEHVLFRGDTGVGKELFARAAHKLSDRAGGPFVPQNAAAIPTELLEEELYGHAADFPNKGMPERKGIIGEAEGGYVFFDEIGEMSKTLQSHLLRLLDGGGQYRRLGDPRTRHTDLRVIGATNRSLEDGLKHDLHPRFKRHVELSPLSARMEDIPLIVRAYARKLLAQRSPLIARFTEERPDGTRDVRIGIDFIEALLRCDHPTNVRGLERAVLDSMMLSKGRTLRAFPDLIGRMRRAPARQEVVPEKTPGGHVRITPELEARARELLDGSHGSLQRAADALNLSRGQVKRLRDRLGIGRTPSDDDDTPEE